MFRAHGRRRRPELRHGGVVARSGAAPHRRHRLRRGAFTNLTRDHLDFHTDLDEYFLGKRRLFLPRRRAPAGRRRRSSTWPTSAADGSPTTAGRSTATTCGRSPSPTSAAACAAASADAQATDLRLGAEGSRFTLKVPRLGVQQDAGAALAARFNVENALTAATSMLALGLPLEAVVDGLASAQGVPGRFESVRAGQPFTVVVDYSHTPDSLQNALQAARDFATGRVLVVFGCGGDRDRGKRPLMGAIGARLADLVFVTSDNPRTEDPLAIIDEIVAGVPAEHRGAWSSSRTGARRSRCRWRRPAPATWCSSPARAMNRARLIGDRRIPFDDRIVAGSSCRARRGAEELDAAAHAVRGRGRLRRPPGVRGCVGRWCAACPSTAGPSLKATCSSACAASMTTATTSRPPLCALEPPPWSCAARRRPSCRRRRAHRRRRRPRGSGEAGLGRAFAQRRARGGHHRQRRQDLDQGHPGGALRPVAEVVATRQATSTTRSACR